MDVTVNVSGLKELNQLLEMMPEKPAKRALDAGLRSGSNVIRKEAQRRAPVLKSEPRVVKYRGKKRLILPGILRKSIVASNDGIQSNRVTFRIKVTKLAFYAHFLEWGTKKMAAQPFMRPALESKGREAVERMRTITGRAIEREAARLASLLGTKKRGRS